MSVKRVVRVVFRPDNLVTLERGEDDICFYHATDERLNAIRSMVERSGFVLEYAGGRTWVLPSQEAIAP